MTAPASITPAERRAATHADLAHAVGSHMPPDPGLTFRVDIMKVTGTMTYRRDRRFKLREFKSWTDQDDEALRSRIGAGQSVARIAGEMRFSVDAIRIKCGRLGLVTCRHVRTA